MCTNVCVHVGACHCEFGRRHGISCNHKPESGFWESLHVSPDLPVSDTDSSSPPASLSHLPSERLTPYCQCHRQNGNLFTIPSSLCLLSSVVCLLIAPCVSAPSYHPPFIHSVPVVTADSGLSNVPAAAGSSIIKRLRRIEIISIRALRYCRTWVCRLRGLARRHSYFRICQI